MTADVFLQPVGQPFSFEPGQFIFLAFGGVNGWQRHPFSVASAPAERRLEVSVRAVGDYTRDLHDKLKPGTPAKAAGPFGGFDYRGGGQHQIWIAGGIGITPFMSWIRRWMKASTATSCSSTRSPGNRTPCTSMRSALWQRPTRPCISTSSTQAATDTSPPRRPRTASPARPTSRLHVRPPCNDDGAFQGLPPAGYPGQPDPLGAVQHSLIPFPPPRCACARTRTLSLSWCFLAH